MGGENVPVTDDQPTRQLLVLPDRDAAEEVAAEIGRRWPWLGDDLELVREALAGEDDAEDAQWLVVLELPADGRTADGRTADVRTADARTADVRTADLLTALDDLAASHDGWREEAL